MSTFWDRAPIVGISEEGPSLEQYRVARHLVSLHSKPGSGFDDQIMNLHHTSETLARLEDMVAQQGIQEAGSLLAQARKMVDDHALNSAIEPQPQVDQKHQEQYYSAAVEWANKQGLGYYDCRIQIQTPIDEPDYRSAMIAKLNEAFQGKSNVFLVDYQQSLISPGNPSDVINVFFSHTHDKEVMKQLYQAIEPIVDEQVMVLGRNNEDIFQGLKDLSMKPSRESGRDEGMAQPAYPGFSIRPGDARNGCDTLEDQLNDAKRFIRAYKKDLEPQYQNWLMRVNQPHERSSELTPN